MAIVRIMILLVVTTGMAMAVLWHVRETVIVGYRIIELDKKKGILEERNRVLAGQIGTLKSPGRILKNLDDMDIKLLLPVPPVEANNNDNVTKVRKVTKTTKVTKVTKPKRAARRARTTNVVYKSKPKKAIKRARKATKRARTTTVVYKSKAEKLKKSTRQFNGR
ncbi:MAG: hypothetical protein ACUZ8A_07740 [Candidatus Bathyanammoxibius sp.]